jgi:hypothetical protein
MQIGSIHQREIGSDPCSTIALPRSQIPRGGGWELNITHASETPVQATHLGHLERFFGLLFLFPKLVIRRLEVGRAGDGFKQSGELCRSLLGNRLHVALKHKEVSGLDDQVERLEFGIVVLPLNHLGCVGCTWCKNSRGLRVRPLCTPLDCQSRLNPFSRCGCSPNSTERARHFPVRKSRRVQAVSHLAIDPILGSTLACDGAAESRLGHCFCALVLHRNMECRGWNEEVRQHPSMHHSEEIIRPTKAHCDPGFQHPT